MNQKILLVLLILTPSLAFSANLRGRLGIGATNQLANGIPALSLKVQQSRSFAIGALVGFRADQDHTQYGAGLKLYQVIYQEPQLNFYMSGLLATQTFLDGNDSTRTGFQMDATLGTEFHFAGLESIGFSFEFGLSARNANQDRGTTFQTLGDHFLTAGVHFYL